MQADKSQLEIELSLILDAIDAAPWRERNGERAKRIWFAPSAIKRLRSLLDRDAPNVI